MKKSLITLSLGLALWSVSQAATIYYVGSVTGTEVAEWRTSSTSKTLDIDGDNIYGTFGGVNWTIGSAGEQPMSSANPGWAYWGGYSYGEFNNGAYAPVDNLNGVGDTTAGIYAVQWGGVFQFEMTGDASTYAGKTVRVGFMADVLSAGEGAADVSKTFQLVQAAGGSGDSGVVSLRGGGPGNHVPEMYFFDITNLTAGDRFNIVTNGGPGQPGYIGPASWDLVPEPSAGVFGALGVVGLLGRRRRFTA